LLQLAEFELFGTPASGGGVCTGNGPIASGQSVPDYSYEISTSGNVTVKFIPGAPIAGCDMAIFYYRIGAGGYSGFGMTASGGAFTASVSIPNGSAITFYFTYRRSAGGMESNSSATPHSYTVGSTCSGARMALRPLESSVESEEAPGEDVFEVYPNPTAERIFLRTQKNPGDVIKLIDNLGRELRVTILDDESIDVSSLPTGQYAIIVINKRKKAVRRFIKE
jgi:hypothetical protein